MENIDETLSSSNTIEEVPEILSNTTNNSEGTSENPILIDEMKETKEESLDLNSEKENEESHKGVKRTLSSSENHQKRKRRKRLSGKPTNPLMKLNELKPGLIYKCESQQGPPHNPIFCFSVEVNGQNFYGKGNSKQKAKHEAAKEALSSIIQFNDCSLVSSSIGYGTYDQDFSCSKNGMNDEIVITNCVNVEKAVKPSPKKKSLQDIFSDADKKNPCMMLNSIQPNLRYLLEQENTDNPNQRFQMCVQFEGETYRGFGPNKKSAKAAAARAVLASRFAVRFTAQQIMPTLGDVDHDIFSFPQTVADSISRCIFETFSKVTSCVPEYSKWKVLAGIVMSRNENMDDLEVISLGTGTKHLNGEYMSMQGGVLNDCHAEIISRRCLKEYFYSQLELHMQSKAEESIFEKNKDNKFVLKSNYKFHLFISTSPCGDARVFSVHDEDISSSDPHPNRKARGLLRTKIESGEGTIPVKGESIQTWDGVIQGQQRYLTMSCSDKVASWNVLGVQGSLLSHFIEPVYLNTIVLGRLFHPTHMRRAIYGRFEKQLSNVPQPFRLNKPKMCATTNLDSRQLTSSPGFSLNWTTGIKEPEIITTRIGKTVQNQISRISKKSLFERFANIYDYFYGKGEIDEHTYAEVKNLVSSYRNAKTQLIAAFVSAGLGTWVAKPSEQDMFYRAIRTDFT